MFNDTFGFTIGSTPEGALAGAPLVFEGGDLAKIDFPMTAILHHRKVGAIFGPHNPILPALALAHAVTAAAGHGAEYRGCRVDGPGTKVLLIDCEVEQLNKLVADIAALSGGDARAVRRNLVAISLRNAKYRAMFAGLSPSKTRRAITRLCRQHGGALLVLNGLSTLGATVETKSAHDQVKIVGAMLNEAHRRGLACLITYGHDRGDECASEAPAALAPIEAKTLVSWFMGGIAKAIAATRMLVRRWSPMASV